MADETPKLSRPSDPAQRRIPVYWSTSTDPNLSNPSFPINVVGNKGISCVITGTNTPTLDLTYEYIDPNTGTYEQVDTVEIFNNPETLGVREIRGHSSNVTKILVDY